MQRFLSKALHLPFSEWNLSALLCFLEIILLIFMSNRALNFFNINLNPMQYCYASISIPNNHSSNLTILMDWANLIQWLSGAVRWGLILAKDWANMWKHFLLFAQCWSALFPAVFQAAVSWWTLASGTLGAPVGNVGHYNILDKWPSLRGLFLAPFKFLKLFFLLIFFTFFYFF